MKEWGRVVVLECGCVNGRRLRTFFLRKEVARNFLLEEVAV
jgi:hypothetical protein